LIQHFLVFLDPFVDAGFDNSAPVFADSDLRLYSARFGRHFGECKVDR